MMKDLFWETLSGLFSLRPPEENNYSSRNGAHYGGVGRKLKYQEGLPAVSKSISANFLTVSVILELVEPNVKIWLEQFIIRIPLENVLVQIYTIESIPII